jgi:protein-L-isoaspartate(D-aspartate) O-methyltransferase
MSPEFNNIELARAKMIEQQIRPWTVLDPNVLELLRTIRREDFVPKSHRHLAFVDMEVPLPEGQVMLAPKVEARLLQELNLTPSDRVLEIGTGSGFMAALLARMSAHVLSVEKYESLMALAQSNLRQAGITNVELVLGNGFDEHPRWAHVGFDAIVVSGAVEQLPQGLIDRLNPGGRMVAIVGAAPIMQAILLERTGKGLAPSANGIRRVTLFETLTLPLEDATKLSHFRF